jgi:hypothetical protein
VGDSRANRGRSARGVASRRLGLGPSVPKSFVHKSTQVRLDLLTGDCCDSRRVRTTFKYDKGGTHLGPMESSLGILLSGLVVCLSLRLTALLDLAKASQGCLTRRQVVSSVIGGGGGGRRRKCSGTWWIRRKGKLPWKSPSYGNLPHTHPENCGRDEDLKHHDAEFPFEADRSGRTARDARLHDGTKPRTSSITF